MVSIVSHFNVVDCIKMKNINCIKHFNFTLKKGTTDMLFQLKIFPRLGNNTELQFKEKQEYRLSNYRIMEFRNSFRLHERTGDFSNYIQEYHANHFSIRTGSEAQHAKPNPAPRLSTSSPLLFVDILMDKHCHGSQDPSHHSAHTPFCRTKISLLY